MDAAAASGYPDDAVPASTGHSVPSTTWPGHYKPIQRVRYSSVEEAVELMTGQGKDGVPIILEGANVIDSEKWADIDHLARLLPSKRVLVKKSPHERFRYSDASKNIGKYPFECEVVETEMTVSDFIATSKEILESGKPERMYLQETLSGHPEMAQEFASWQWELPIRVSAACGWGLPDSNELFVGMPGICTPLHFDQRENLYYQVRGSKELVVYPFVDYVSMYPFPTTHPCDRQSMVIDPRSPDLDAFPRFSESIGHYAVLQAGDLLYLPYGWWHWFQNLSHCAVSVSFWSVTEPNDLSGGVPDVFSAHMLTRVRRNLESLIAQTYGNERHNESMLRIRDAIRDGADADPILAQARALLLAVKVPLERQDAFLIEMVEGRYGIDWNNYV